MTLDADEFIHRFLIHVLPDGFHRIRHYGLFTNANRAANIALAASSSAYPTQPRQPIRATALKMVKAIKSRKLALTAAGV
jgi:Putative transposase